MMIDVSESTHLQKAQDPGTALLLGLGGGMRACMFGNDFHRMASCSHKSMLHVPNTFGISITASRCMCRMAYIHLKTALEAPAPIDGVVSASMRRGADGIAC